jgi:hypothetical protein
MGQQQLLLLVLSTVIVGLATVAGIQAFDEGQSQATQDALTQRGLTIGTDITAALNQPSQLGGVSFSSDPAQIAAAAGLNAESGTAEKDDGTGQKDIGKGIPAPGASSNADCDITTVGGSSVTIICAENGKGSTNASQASDNSMGQTVTVEAGMEESKVVSINGTNVGSI